MPRGPGPITHMPQQMPPPQQMQMHQMPPQQMSPQQMPPQHQIPPQFIMRQMPPQQMIRQMPPPQHQMPPVPDQIMQAPRSEQQHPQPEVRIQLQRIPLPIRGEMNEPVQIRELTAEPVQIRELPIAVHNQDISNGLPPQVQVQRIPLAVALERAGITPEDLKNIRQMAEEHIQQELRHLAEDNNSNDASDSSEEDSESHPDSEQHGIPPAILQMGRAAFGRSLVTPVRIPVNMMQSEGPSAEIPQPDRPHCKYKEKIFYLGKVDPVLFKF